MQHMDMTNSAARFWAFITNFLPKHWGQNPVARDRQQARTAVLISDVFCPNRWIPKVRSWLVFSFSVLVRLTEGPSLVSACIVLKDALTEDFLLGNYFNNFPI